MTSLLSSIFYTTISIPPFSWIRNLIRYGYYRIFGIFMPNVWLHQLRITTNNGENPEWAATQFVQNLEEKYGPIHPNFFIGSFQQLCNKAKNEFKFMIIYIHSPLHQDTDKFCREILCTQLISDFFNENFLCWGGNINFSDVYKVNNTLSVSTYPFMAVLYNNPIEGIIILERIEGLINPEQLLLKLTEVLEIHGPTLANAWQEFNERERNRKIIEEQDMAFLQSLKEDQEKEMKEKEERRQLEEQQKAIEREKEKQQKKIEEKKKRKEEILAKLPPEPSDNEKGVTHLVIRLPDGCRLHRKFLSHQKLEEIFNFVESQSEYDNTEYELVMNFPRKIFNDKNITIEEAGLFPQASLFLQEK
jgi:FAS-associated factor 2